MTRRTPVHASTLAVAVAATGLMLLSSAPAQADPPSHAPAYGYRSHDDRYGHDRDDYRWDDRDHDRYHDRDCDHDDRHRYGRDYVYYPAPRRASGFYRDPRRVVVVQRLPSGYRHIDFRGMRYFYYPDGRWYQPYGAQYAAVAPPAGLMINGRGLAVVANVPIVRW